LNISESYRKSYNSLKKIGVKDPQLEAEVLIRHVLNISRTQFYISLEKPLLSIQEKHIDSLIKERLNSKPLPYITNHKEFYNLDLIVNPSVLIPRPETELLIDIAIDYSNNINKNNLLRVAELGTGSGAISIAIAKNIENSQIKATDISKKSLEVAKINARKNSVDKQIIFFHKSIFKPINNLFELIISNPPYIKTKTLKLLEKEVQKEPQIALDGGEDGLKFIKYIINNYFNQLSPNGSIIIEIDPNQKDIIKNLTNTLNSCNVEFYKDINNLTRAVQIKKTTS
tara:strand:- start:683 stop:1537 length:855 start_codon:yes stop_codon:yes gene_type:complete